MTTVPLCASTFLAQAVGIIGFVGEDLLGLQAIDQIIGNYSSTSINSSFIKIMSSGYSARHRRHDQADAVGSGNGLGLQPRNAQRTTSATPRVPARMTGRLNPGR